MKDFISVVFNAQTVETRCRTKAGYNIVINNPYKQFEKNIEVAPPIGWMSQVEGAINDQQSEELAIKLGRKLPGYN